MTAFRLLLKFMLCMCLILNGSGRALAGVHAMASMHDQPSTAMPAMPGMTNDCDEGAAHHQAATDAESLAHGQACPDTDSAHSDCCQSANACGCACEQHSPATLGTVTVVAASIGDTQVLPRARDGHASPPPPRVIRPPIA